MFERVWRWAGKFRTTERNLGVAPHLIEVSLHQVLDDARYWVGLGTVSDVGAPHFSIDFMGRHQWDLRQGDRIFMRVKDGQPRLPQDPIQVERFEENMRRIFPGIADSSIALARNVMDLLFKMGRGSTIVFAADAAEEAARLESQGTRIQPAAINKEFLERASSIDGAMIADPNGVCHAIGVILDGNATPKCTPARGGRYNSAVRYVGNGLTDRLSSSRTTAHWTLFLSSGRRSTAMFWNGRSKH